MILPQRLFVFGDCATQFFTRPCVFHRERPKASLVIQGVVKWGVGLGLHIIAHLLGDSTALIWHNDDLR